jgi:hypothetical protein
VRTSFTWTTTTPSSSADAEAGAGRLPLIAAVGDYEQMSNIRRVAVVGGPLAVLVVAAIFGVALWKQDRVAGAYWVAVAGLVVATIALVVTWLTWVRPMSPVSSSRSEVISRPDANEVKGDKSFGSATNSQIVYGNRNRLGEGKKR